MKRDKKILIAFDTVEEGFEELIDRFDVTRPSMGRNFTREELQQMEHDYDVLATEFSIPVDKELIDMYPNLKLISNYAVGYNNIDIAYAQSKGIVVTNTPKSVINPTAEHTMALLLSCSRQVAEWDRTMRRRRSSEKSLRNSGMGTDLYGKTVGIIGYGNIGKAVGKLCQAFGMRVVYNNRHRLPEALENALGATYASVEDLLRCSDVVSLHTPYNPQSHHLIDAQALSIMKPKAILINAARGPVVDEAALVQALKDGRLAAAGLDVYENNDNPLSELYDMDNVVMTPHIGTQTYESRVNMARELSDNIIGFFEEDRPISRVR